ncbi:SDR family NAD(P)-dependent oxidoreductase [Halostreptopolyspora alba]|uniref:SDR family oxidoreductase n=1 Tax=Halostreptopolyspora alba TaxID=2487137 RepID=A0A3N0ED21_9ACTN|nr:SDR family oxidoreductase [Nocardiopsaceae bacterium YIM 96095]
MSHRFTGKTALVTGGGSGIGQNIARAFAAEGASVVVAGRKEAPLRETVKLVEEEGGDAAAVTADVTSSDDVARLVAATVETFGSLDVAVNNAGMLAAAGPLPEVDEREWRTMLDVNVTGALLAMRHQIAHMRQHGGGAIVNVSSNAGPHTQIPGIAAYGATKAAVTALSRAAALTHIGEGVRINVVSPGATDTSMSLLPGETRQDRDDRLREASPIGRVGERDEIAAGVLYLASPESGYAVGTDLVLDGGAAV